MGLENIVGKLEKTKAGIISQRVPIENGIEKIMNVLETTDFKETDFEMIIDDIKYKINIEFCRKSPWWKAWSAKQSAALDEKGYSFYSEEANFTSNGLWSHPENKPFVNNLVITIDGLVLTAIRKPIWEKGGFFSSKLIPSGISIIPQHSDFTEIKCNGFFTWLTDKYTSGIDDAKKVLAYILILRNLERYLEHHFSAISNMQTSTPQNVAIRTVNIPPLMTKCNSCGAPNPDNEEKCGYCGSSLRPVPK